MVALHIGSALRPSVDTPARVTLASYVDLLRWQARWRALVAVLVAGALATLQSRGWFVGAPSDVLRVVAVYLGAVVAGVLLARVHAHPAPGTIGPAAYLTSVADVAALVAVTAVAARPGHHDWVLVIGFFVVHLAEFSFGRPASVVAIVATVTGYLLLAATRGDASVAEQSEVVVAVIAFVAVALAFLAQYASRRRRLRRIIALFERAEEGDFEEAYDVAADQRPDAVTAVGGAYNRVRARFESLVLTDPLTACLNRRGFEQALARELARADRARSEVALLAVDIDDFKKVNDTYGHMAGDDTLHQLGTLLLGTVRTGDMVARVGGDEFVILCPDTDVDGARQLGERVCQLAAAHEFTGRAIPVRLTISAGIAAIGGGAEDHIAAELQLRADRALYDAKRAGRNRVQCWETTAVR